MARHKAAKNCTILPWLSEKSDCREGRFLQIGNSIFLSDAYQQLSSGAQNLYLCMALESGGRKNYTFPLAAAKKYGIAERSFRRFVDELSQAGFIIKHSMANLRQPNEYEFSFEWKQEKPP